MLEKVKTYVKTSLLSLPLSVILSFSPLPPLATMVYLSRLKVYEEIPGELVDSEELRERGYAPEFIQLYEEAFRAQRTGRREGLVNYLERRIREIRTSLDLLDYNVTTMVEVLSLLTVVIPVMLASIAAFIFPGFLGTITIASTVPGLIIILFASFFITPPELWLRRPRLITLAPLLLFLPILYVTRDVALALTIASFPSAFLVWWEERRNFKVFEEALELVVKGTYSRNPILAGINDLDYLLGEKWYGVAKAAVTTLYILYTQGGRKFGEGVTKLMTFIRDHVETMKAIRKKAFQSLIYGIVMACIAGACMAIVVSTFNFMVSIPHGAVSTTEYGLVIPTQAHLSQLHGVMPIYIAVTSLTYAVGVAALRDGNPLYFPLYLALILPTSYLSYQLALQYAPMIFGRGR